ncbi:hypothetical protein Rhopal_004414-T1 [Rhodotorula paludigena]|uniref:Uncharacterized protein n=1 Tax=Rhodotorula paludigena TaxID=86838 RepID=A0AAV5GMF7_9BASI|nr:hypothetical protein Rhopal_004414-T1 [Rhodotorula paludigena]
MAPKRRATTLDMGDFASPARSTSSDEDDDYARFGSRKAALSVSKRRRTEMAQVELSSSDVEILGPPVKRGARVGEGSTANGATLGDRTNKAVVQRPSASSAETVILLSDDSEAADSSDLEIVDCRTDAASSLTEVAYKADEGFLANVLHRVDVSSDVDLGNDYVGYCRDDEEPMLIDDQISPSAITLLNLPAGVLDIVWSFLADDCAGGRAVCKTLLPQTSAWRAPFAAIASGSQCAIGSGRDGQKQAVEPARAPVSKPASSSVDHAEDEDGDAYEVLEHSAWIETFYDQLKADGKLPASVNKSREALLLAFRRRHTALARADAPAPADLPTDGYVVGFPSVLYSLIVQIYQRIKSDTFGSKVDPAVLAYFTENSPRVIFDYVAPVYTDYPATQELYLALRRGKQVQLGTYLRRLSQLERTALLYAHEGLSTEHAGGNRFSEVPVLGRYVGKAVVWKARWRTYLNGISRHMTGVHVQALYDFYLGEYNVGRHDGYPAARPDSPPLWTSFIVHRLPEATTWNESFVSIFETIACDALGAYDHHSMLLPEYCREKGVERDCSLTPENGAIGLNRAYPICAPQSQAIRASALDRVRPDYLPSS